MARFAVDTQGGIPGLEPSLLPVVAEGELAAVTVLAIGRPFVCSQSSVRRPVGQIRQRNVSADRHPVMVLVELHKPVVPMPAEVEWQEAHRAIRSLGKERLSTATHHEPTAHHRFNLDVEFRTLHRLNDEQVVSLPVDRGHDGIGKDQRSAIESGDDLNPVRVTTSSAVRRVSPQIIHLEMAFRTRF